VGEIGVSGPSVTRAYWGGERFDGTLRTGDLGFLEDGELYVTGRIKALLIVNGRKLHAEDVERTVVESHPGGWPGGVAALAIDTGDREQLVICQELDRRADASHADVMHAVKLAVAEQHQVAVAEVVLLRPGQIPRTSSGKVRRDACRDAYRSGQWVPR
jgi:acyl-CoA synthetase (AMP-forming)/AMP-acid ligase II